MNSKTFVFLFSTFAFFFISCATTGKMMKLNLDMTKNEVINIMGEPDVVRGSIRNKFDQVIEVWEYGEYKDSGDAWRSNKTSYWFYFYNRKLVQWGQAGDWSREADKIYEYRFH